MASTTETIHGMIDQLSDLLQKEDLTDFSAEVLNTCYERYELWSEQNLKRLAEGPRTEFCDRLAHALIELMWIVGGF